MKKIIKNMLLIVTLIYTILWMCAIDSILDNHLLLESVGILIGLVCIIIFIFSKEELNEFFEDKDLKE